MLWAVPPKNKRMDTYSSCNKSDMPIAGHVHIVGDSEGILFSCITNICSGNGQLIF